MITVEPDPALAAVKTYNWLRIALAALVLLLYSAVVLEWWAAGQCLQTSISAYYYTPVHAVFVGVLVTMGVCLVALKGNTNGEDVLMNLAGLLAPGVAFIPTPGAEECSSSRLDHARHPGHGREQHGGPLHHRCGRRDRRRGPRPARGRADPAQHHRHARPGAVARGARRWHRVVLRRP